MNYFFPVVFPLTFLCVTLLFQKAKMTTMHYTDYVLLLAPVWLTCIFGKTSTVILNWKDAIWCHICRISCVSILFKYVISWDENCRILSIFPQTLLTLRSSGCLLFLNSIFSRIMEDEYSRQMLCKSVTCWHCLSCVEKCVQTYFFFFFFFYGGKNPNKFGYPLS